MLLFQCNCDIRYLDINEHLPKFYRDIILHWQEINTTTPKEKGDILNQVIWNNRFIRVNKASMYFSNWNQASVQKLSCLFNDEENSQSSLNAFAKKFNLKCNFLQYYGLLSVIPSEWKTILKQEDHHHVKQPPNMSLEIDKLLCKTIYSKLINCQNFPPVTAGKRLIESGFDTQERKKIYSLPFNVTKEVKLSVFQYRIVHNILYANIILYNMKKKPHPFSTFCANTEQTIVHIFFSCPVAEFFWAEFTDWHNSLSKKKKSALTKKEIIYGVLNNWSSWSTHNH